MDSNLIHVQAPYIEMIKNNFFFFRLSTNDVNKTPSLPLKSKEVSSWRSVSLSSGFFYDSGSRKKNFTDLSKSPHGHSKKVHPKKSGRDSSRDYAWENYQEKVKELKSETLLTTILREKLYSEEMDIKQLQADLAGIVRERMKELGVVKVILPKVFQERDFMWEYFGHCISYVVVASVLLGAVVSRHLSVTDPLAARRDAFQRSSLDADREYHDSNPPITDLNDVEDVLPNHISFSKELRLQGLGKWLQHCRVMLHHVAGTPERAWLLFSLIFILETIVVAIFRPKTIKLLNATHQ
ncbi:hypothetical protein FXO37_29323 [Capsicum annuum]|nr:hypothetical protein FXO37_29323 [Capsicum annuum]